MHKRIIFQEQEGEHAANALRDRAILLRLGPSMLLDPQRAEADYRIQSEKHCIALMANSRTIQSYSPSFKLG